MQSSVVYLYANVEFAFDEELNFPVEMGKASYYLIFVGCYNVTSPVAASIL